MKLSWFLLLHSMMLVKSFFGYRRLTFRTTFNVYSKLSTNKLGRKEAIPNSINVYNRPNNILKSSKNIFVLQSDNKDGGGGVVETNYKRGDVVQVTVVQFGPLGASVTIDDGSATGLISQKEISMFREKRDGTDIMMGETLQGYVERVREDGKINIFLRSPSLMSRLVEVRQIVLDALEGSPDGVIPVGDKSDPEDIRSYFHGVSKKDFKNAIGSLYKDGLVTPSSLETLLVPLEKRDESKLKGEEARLTKSSVRTKDLRDSSKTIFIGNLPLNIKEETLFKEIQKSLGDDRKIQKLRIAHDENEKARGFAYIDFLNETDAESAMIDLKGILVGGRAIRTDFSDPARRRPNSDSSLGSGSGSSSGIISDDNNFQSKLSEDRMNGGSFEGRNELKSWVKDASITLRQNNAKKIAEYRSKMGDVAIAHRDNNLGNNGGFNQREDWKKDSVESKFAIPRQAQGTAATLSFSNLPYSIDEAYIRSEVEKFSGKSSVAKVRVVLDKVTGSSRGFAYVDFYSRGDADLVYDEMHGSMIAGRAIRIKDASREYE